MKTIADWSFDQYLGQLTKNFNSLADRKLTEKQHDALYKKVGFFKMKLQFKKSGKLSGQK